ncbi:hypothetical protein BURK2_00241 [Burkholderiales bacterium]|nr:MAG: Hdr-like menaquinol oxidoreductase cytochrome c subunit [Burkholderiales bacterium]CAG0951841.1 hypothetical protein BURK2_00241 [Burkholderiales bacterium]
MPGRFSAARGPVLTAVLIAVLAGLAFAAARDSVPGRAPVFDAPRGERCIADVAEMRRNHMRHLVHQRDAVVREGKRQAGQGLQDCITCHAGEKSASVLGETGFCASCHRYAAVAIDCFECHSPKAATAQTGAKP